MNQEPTGEIDLGQIPVVYALHGIIHGVVAFLLAVATEMAIMLFSNTGDAQPQWRLYLVAFAYWAALHLKGFASVFSWKKSGIRILNEKNTIHHFEGISAAFLVLYETFHSFYPNPDHASLAQLSHFFTVWFCVLLFYHGVFMVIFWEYMKTKNFIMVIVMIATTVFHVWRG